MELFLGIIIGVAAGLVLAATAFIDWLYDDGEFPPLRVVASDLQAARTAVRILRIGNDALAQMPAATRQRG